MSNPLDGQERAQRAGAKLFARECSSCHGRNGVGGLGKAPPLRQSEVYDAPPGALFWILRNGALHRGMPSFAHLPEAQRWQIISWLKARP
jgi:mono/diheme cytochrome c family protein